MYCCVLYACVLYYSDGKGQCGEGSSVLYCSVLMFSVLKAMVRLTNNFALNVKNYHLQEFHIYFMHKKNIFWKKLLPDPCLEC